MFLRLPDLYRYFNTRCDPLDITEGKGAAISKTFRDLLSQPKFGGYIFGATSKNLTAKCGGEKKTNGLLAEEEGKYLVQVGGFRDHVVILSANWSLRECLFFAELEPSSSMHDDTVDGFVRST